MCIYTLYIVTFIHSKSEVNNNCEEIYARAQQLPAIATVITGGHNLTFADLESLVQFTCFFVSRMCEFIICYFNQQVQKFKITCRGKAPQLKC